MPNMVRRGLYVITDARLLSGPDLVPAVVAAIGGGATLVQYRDKSADTDRRHREATELVSACHALGVPLLINDDVELARSAGAQGVHLGQRDASIAAARTALGPEAIIGVTCHADLALALRAQADGADYVAFGRFFASHTKPEAPPAPLALLPAARARLRIPIAAIGGITPENGGALVAAGADLLAVIHGVFGPADIRAAARRYTELFATARPAG